MSMSYDLKFGKGPGARRRDPSDGLRVLVVGDFLGDGVAMEPRRAVKVNVGDLDGLVSKLRPSLALAPAGSRPLEFRKLDDFHPDAVLSKVPSLADLVNLRQRLNHPTTSAAAAAELRGAAAAAAASAKAPEAAPAGGSLLENLLGGTPKDRPAATQTALEATGIDGMIRSIVAPHVSAGRDPAADDLVRVTDAVIAAGLRAILHDPRFQALEAAYRGLAFLTSRSESGAVDYFVLHATREELAREAASESPEFLSTVLDAGGRGYSVVIALHEFGPTEGDLAFLAALSSRAQDAAALLLGGASPALAGAKDTLALPRVRASDANGAWEEFREASGGPHVGLSVPRFLLRTPYGKRTDPIESFAFEELEGVDDHAAFLWGNSAWVAAFALLVASGEAPAAFVVDDLPTVVLRKEGESHLLPCAEVLLNEASIDALVNAGLMPVVSDASRAEVTLVRAQSVASPPTPLALASE